MATIKIEGRPVQVDDSFLRLSPEQQDATVDEIAAQMAKEGAGPQPATPQGMNPALADYIQQNGLPGYGPAAAIAQGAESVPIVGPWLRGGLENIAAAPATAQGLLQGKSLNDAYGSAKANAEAGLAAAVKGSPVEATTGAVAGTLAPFGIGGAVPGVARVLGMEGGLLSQSGFGLLSGVGIGGTDTLARGGSLDQAGANALIGGAAGGLLPGAGALAGKVISAVTGKAVPAAAKTLGRAMRDDNILPAEVPQKLQELGDGAMVMDLGPNLQRQAGALAAVPGGAQKMVRGAVEARGEGASARVTQDVAQTVGTGPELQTLTDQIIAAQKAAADPLYTAVRDVPLNATGNLKFVFGTPMGKQAFKDAVELMANDGVTPPNQLTVGLIDYAKRALNDIAAAAGRQGKGNVARQAGNLARLLAKEADAQVPAYADARNAFAGPAQVLDAIEAGQGVFTKATTPGQLKAMLDHMTVSERDAFLQAARSSIESQMGNAVNDALSLRNMFKKGWNEQKLRLILGDDVADDLMRRINREAVFGQTAHVVAGNSETAARTAAMSEVAPDMQKIEPASGLAWVFRAFNAARAGLHTPKQGKTNQQLAQLLMSGNFGPRAADQVARGMKPRSPFPIPGAALPMIPQHAPLKITVGANRGSFI